MITMLRMLFVKGLFLMVLGGYVAYKSCDPITWLTVNPALMQVGTIVSMVGVIIAFGCWMVLDTLRLNAQ